MIHKAASLTVPSHSMTLIGRIPVECKTKGWLKGQIVECECDNSIEHKGNNSNVDNLLRLMNQ